MDLLGAVEKDENGEAGSGGGEGEVKAEDGSGEGRRVNVVSLGETDVRDFTLKNGVVNPPGDRR